MAVLIAAFDLGSHMAIARRASNGRVVSGHCDISGNRCVRAKETMDWVAGAIHRMGVGLVVYERPFCRGLSATRALWGIAGIIEAVATAEGCAVVDASRAEIKKFAAGFGGAGKETMIYAAQQMGYPYDNEHEADAYCLLKYAEKYVTISSTAKKKRKRNA